MTKKEKSALLQGPATNTYVCLDRRATPSAFDKITGETLFKLGELSVYVDTRSCAAPLFTSRQKMLLDIIALKFAAVNKYRSKGTLNREISFSWAELGELCGVKMTTVRRKSIVTDLNVLCTISIEYPPGLCKTKLLEYVRPEGGKITAAFSEGLAGYLNGAYIMQYPLALAKMGIRHSSTYELGRKLALHSSMRASAQREELCTLSIRKLLESCPSIPSPEYVKCRGRQYTQLIRSPFEKSLNELVSEGILESWEYRLPQGGSVQADRDCFQAFLGYMLLFKMK